MAKLRTNHQTRGRGKGSPGFARLILLLLLLGLVIGSFLVKWPTRLAETLSEGFDENPPTSATQTNATFQERLFLPVGPSDQVIHHTYYSLGYDNDWEQPRWVAYRLERESLRRKGIRRQDDFRPDPKVRDGSAELNDYRGSGFTRGHLVPAGDMAFDSLAMSESFYLSNISPQLAEHNGAVWRELEETVRDWARRYGDLYVVTGPVIEENADRIGGNDVAVPDAFYKVVLRADGRSGIGFLIPHEIQTKPLEDFALSIDEIETITGLDFFPELTDLSTPSLEASRDVTQWPGDQKRYQRRLQDWNRKNN